MKPDALPSPGLIPTGQILRQAVTRACSYVEVMASMQGGKASQAKELDTFFVAARAAMAALIDAVLPTYVSGLITAAAPTKLVLTYSEALDPTIVPAVGSFVTSPAKTFSSVVVQGTKVTLTATTAFVAGATTVTYTAPGTNALRDTSGNLLATHGPSAITNQVV